MKTINNAKPMTQNEERLLEIAKNVIEMNTEIGAALTGSLFLVHNGLRIMREATDIDIICDVLCEQGSVSPRVPDGFKLLNGTGNGSDVDSLVFKNEEGIKIDFMWSDEPKKPVNGVLCGSLENLVRAKLGFARIDKTEESRTKHLKDVIYLIDMNDIELFYNNALKEQI